MPVSERKEASCKADTDSAARLRINKKNGHWVEDQLPVTSLLHSLFQDDINFVEVTKLVVPDMLDVLS